jgi:hypothetical protein
MSHLIKDVLERLLPTFVLPPLVSFLSPHGFKTGTNRQV